jgi:hypothetical protein
LSPDLTLGAISSGRFAPPVEPEDRADLSLIEESVKANSAPDTRDSDPMSARTDPRFIVRPALSFDLNIGNVANNVADYAVGDELCVEIIRQTQLDPAGNAAQAHATFGLSD